MKSVNLKYDNKRTLFSIGFMLDSCDLLIMIEWIIGFLVAKWWNDKEEKKKKEPPQKSSVNVELTIPFGYVRDGESLKDLQ